MSKQVYSHGKKSPQLTRVEQKLLGIRYISFKNNDVCYNIYGNFWNVLILFIVHSFFEKLSVMNSFLKKNNRK